MGGEFFYPEKTLLLALREINQIRSDLIKLSQEYRGARKRADTAIQRLNHLENQLQKYQRHMEEHRDD